jgi:hypothetical protein
MPNKIIKNSFNAGELSPYLDGRTDLAKYYNGCSMMVNATVLPYGGAVKRSGTEYIGKAKGYCRLIPFEFSADDAMIIEFGNQYIRFYKDGDRVYESATDISGITQASPGVVTTSAAHGFSDGDYVKFNVIGMTELNSSVYEVEYINTTTFSLIDVNGTAVDTTGFTAFTSGDTHKVHEIASDYLAADLFDIHFIQSADVVYLTHEDYPPAKLSRLADNNWTLADIDFEGGPFLTGNTTTSYLLETDVPSKLTGTHDGGDGSLTLVDSSQTWTTDEFAGLPVYNDDNECYGFVASNTATEITFDSDGLKGRTGTSGDYDFDDGDTYYISKYYIPSGTTGLTLTATGHTPFLGTAADVGTKWELSHTRQDNSETVSASGAGVTKYTYPVLVNGDFNVDASGFESGDTDTVTLQRKVGSELWQDYRTFKSATAYSATEDQDNVYYRLKVFHQNSGTTTTSGTISAKAATWSGVVEVTAQSSTSACTVKALTNIYYDQTGSDNETSLWSEGAWSETYGYPQAIAFHEDRLWYGGTLSQPQTLWGSQSSDYDNFNVGIALANESVQITINDNDVSRIQWLMADEILIAGTVKKEYKVAASSIDDPITPNDIKVTPQSSHGSGRIQPELLNNAIFYVQGQGRKIRAMRFTDATLKYQSDDATLLASHMFEDSPVQMSSQRIPDSILWVVRSDGTLCSFSYEPDEEVVAWARHVTGGTLYTPAGNTSYFKSAAVIRGDTEDDIWVSVQRNINGSDTYYIEKFSTRIFDQTDEANMLDSIAVSVSTEGSQNIVLASDTVRCGSGLCNSSLCGGTTS